MNARHLPCRQPVVPVNRRSTRVAPLRATALALLMLLPFLAAVAAHQEDLQSEGTQDVVTYIDNASGTFTLGLVGAGLGALDDDDPIPATGLPVPNMQEWALLSDLCKRTLVADLQYTPRQLIGDENAPVDLDYQFVLQAKQGDTVLSREVFRPSTHIMIGNLPTAAPFTFQLILRTGILVDWNLTLVGTPTLVDPNCAPPPLPNIRISEIEANPAGQDRGNEWVELHNLGGAPLDLSAWTLTTTHGQTVTVTIPDDTTVGPDARIVITHTAQWLDNNDEAIILRDATGMVWHQTDPRDDQANDDRTWQDLNGTWTFTTATPGT